MGGDEKGTTVAEKTPRKPPAKGKKKTWASPRVKSGRLFESNSLACSKNQPGGNGGECDREPQMS
jgi:hypothetical protein